MKSCVLVKVSKQTLSFWYQIEGGDYAALTLKEGNVIPLCFYVNGNEFNVGSFAKERCLVNDPNAYTDYFENVKNPSKHFSLVGDSKPYKLLLYFGIENYLSHFIKTILYKSESIEAYRESFCLRFWFDDDLENQERLLVISLFKEAGYENVGLVTIDDYLKKHLSGTSAKDNARIYLSAINNDLYVQLFSAKHELLGKFKLPELGSDPRAKILAKLILEDVKEANPHLFINDELEIPHIIPHCTALLSSLSPLMRSYIELSTGARLDYKIKLKDLEGRLAYNRGIEDKVIPQLELILGQNGLSAALVDLFLLGDQISTNYFKEKLTKKFPNVIGVPNAIESKILKSIFAEIASNLYELEVVGKKPAVEVPFSQELKEGNTGPTQEKEKKGPPPIKTGLTLPGISTQGFGSTLPQTPPVVKVPISTAPSKVEDAPRVQVKPVTPTTVEKFVIPTQVAKAVPPPPEVRLDSKQSLPPKSTIPDLPGSLTLQGRLAKKIQQNYPDAEVKKVDKDNYVDIFIPSVYPKRGAHLFFNTSKDEIKIGFYCRDEEFIKGVLAKQPTLEAYSQGIRPKGNKSYSSVEESISATFDFLSKIVGKLELPPDQKNEPRKGPPPIISVSTNRVPPPPPPPPPIKKK
ncbi:MAG: hypothetical protein ACO22X_07790 [Algoriphagus sp.]